MLKKKVKTLAQQNKKITKNQQPKVSTCYKKCRSTGILTAGKKFLSGKNKTGNTIFATGFSPQAYRKEQLYE